MAIIGTKGFQLKYWPFMLTTSSLTRDNYQQIRLFIDSVLLLSILCFLACLEIFSYKKEQFNLHRLFPCLSALNTQKKQTTFLFTELTFQSTEI